MASSQEISTEVVAKLNDEQKAHLAQQMKEIENTDHDQGKTQVTLRYFSNLEEFINLYAQHDWAGVAKDYPKSLRNDGAPVTFVHYANIPGGNSKGAVAYSDVERYWLVGWDEHKNKVYVQLAPKGIFMDWPAIEKALDASGRTSVALDPKTGKVAAMASISNGKVSSAFYSFNN